MSVQGVEGGGMIPLYNYDRSDLKIPWTADRKRSTKSQHQYNNKYKNLYLGLAVMTKKVVDCQVWNWVFITNSNFLILKS